MYWFWLILHMIGLTMSVGTGFSMIALGIGTKDMELAERAKYMLRAFIISKVGAIGLVLLIISGVGMLMMQFQTIMIRGGWYFHVKLTLIVVIIGLFGTMQAFMKKARQENGGPIMAKIPKLGQAMLFTSILIIIFAVLAFQ